MRVIDNISKLVLIASFYLAASEVKGQYKAVVSIEDRKIVYMDNLIANRDPTIRIVVKKNEIEGLKDMDKLIVTEALEEAYDYLPEKEEWHEVGYDEKIMKRGDGSYISHITIDIDYEKKLVRENKILYRYHYHSADTLVSRFIEGLEVDSTENFVTEILEKYKESSAHIEASFGNNVHLSPSVVDIESMITGEKRYANIEGFKFLEKLKSEHGLAEYSLTEKGLEYYISVDSVTMDLTKGQVFTEPDSTMLFSTDLIKIRYILNKALYKEKEIKATIK